MSYLMEKISTILKHPALIRKILMGQAVPFLLQSLPSLQREKVFRLQSNLQRLMSQWQSNTLFAIGKGCGPTHHFYELYQHGLSKE